MSEQEDISREVSKNAISKPDIVLQGNTADRIKQFTAAAADPSDMGAERTPPTLSQQVETPTAPVDDAVKKDYDYRGLKDKVKKYESELNEYKTKYPEERFNELAEYEAKYKDIESKYTEKDETLKKLNIYADDDFHSEFMAPLDQISARVKSTLKQDSINEDLWDDILQARDKREIERLIEDNVDSKFLKEDLYESVKQAANIAGRMKEAIAAPTKYVESIKQRKKEEQNLIKAEVAKTYPTIFEAGKGLVETLLDKLGDGRVLELTELKGNTKHNNEIVKPIKEYAYKQVDEKLRRLAASGVKVTVEDAANELYLAMSAAATQNINADRISQYAQNQELRKQLAQKEAELTKLKNKGSFVPSGRGSNTESAPAAITGVTSKDRISQFISSVLK